MAVGVVKFFIPPKGWGFITYIDELGNHLDCLVHYTEIISDKPYKKLYKGQVVEFKRVTGPRGLMAINVKPTALNVKNG